VLAHNTDAKIIVGGPHIYNLAHDLDAETQDFVFEQIGADIYVIDSQGEATLARVVRVLGNGGQLNEPVLCRQRECLARTPAMPERNDLAGASDERLRLHGLVGRRYRVRSTCQRQWYPLLTSQARPARILQLGRGQGCIEQRNTRREKRLVTASIQKDA
jgi:hypothetical protein